MKKTAGRTHTFTLILSGLPGVTEAVSDALFEAGCDDGLLGESNEVVFLDFDRQAPSRREAILSAIRAVESAGIGARVVRVEPEELGRTAAAINAALELRRHTRSVGEATELCELLESGWRTQARNGRKSKSQ
jgi:hypothetical protein